MEPSPPPPSRKSSAGTAGGKDSALCARRASPASPINSLSIGDSLLRLLGTSAAAATEDSGDENENTEEATAASSSDDAEAGEQAGGSPKTVSFKSQVRVVLVPCRRELHSLNGQLWWGADDYVDFR